MRGNKVKKVEGSGGRVAYGNPRSSLKWGKRDELRIERETEER